MNAITPAEALRDGVAAILALGGFVGVCVGVLALLRFPDLYTRAHAAALILGLPAGVLLIGLAAASGDLRCAAALVVLGGLMASLGPVVSFACASAAHADGLAPVIGRIARSGQQR